MVTSSRYNWGVLIGLLWFFSVGGFWGTSQASSRKERDQVTDLEHAASKLLITSQNSLEKGEYWKTAQDLILIMDYYPDYSRIDEVMCNLGNCLFQMELFKTAEKIYRYLILNMRNSSYVPYALYGLEQVYYKTKQYERAIEYFHLLRKRFPNITVGEGVYYYGGLSYFHLGDYDNTTLILSSIDSESEYWGYALYTRSVANFKKKIVEAAISDLKTVVKLPRLYNAWFNLRERAKLVLGLTYYELREYEKAIDYLKKVSSQNENYSKALLGLGWCFIKLGRCQDAVPPLEEFLQKYPRSEFVPEVYLLLGQSYLKIRLYDKAIAYFNRIMALFPDDPESEEWIKKMTGKIRQHQKQIEQQRTDLLILESRLIDAIRLPSKKYFPKFMLKECDKLEEKRTDLLRVIDAEYKSCLKLMRESDHLTRVVERRSRDWRSYAQYGISRALFLKEQE